MSSKSLTYLKLNLWEWINGAIDKVNAECLKKEWNDAWFKTYKELGGESQNSGEKGCPKNAAYFLFKFGRIKGSNMPLKTPSDQDVLDKYGKNGVYAKMAIDILQAEPSLNLNSLWKKVQDKYRKEIGKKPAQSNQGAATVAFKLFNNRKIILSR